MITRELTSSRPGLPRAPFLGLFGGCLLAIGACGQDAREAPPVVEPPAEEAQPEETVEAEPEAEPPTEPDPAPETEAIVDPEPEETNEFAGPEGETPQEAVERCRATSEFERCLIATLDEVEVRARERQLLIEAHETLGNEDSMLDHMEKFLDDYPRDRRGNGYRIRLREAGRL